MNYYYNKEKLNENVFIVENGLIQLGYIVVDGPVRITDSCYSDVSSSHWTVLSIPDLSPGLYNVTLLKANYSCAAIILTKICFEMNAYYDFWFDILANLSKKAWNKEESSEPFEDGYIFKNIGTACVDSGQLGIFDEKMLLREFELWNKEKEKDEKLPIKERKFHVGEERFYDVCCQLTTSSVGAGIYINPEEENINRYEKIKKPRGVISSSGYGDGSYPVYKILEKNSVFDHNTLEKCVGLILNFGVI